MTGVGIELSQTLVWTAKNVKTSLLSQVLLLSILLFLYTFSQTIYQTNLMGRLWRRAGQWSSSASFASSDLNWDLRVFHMAGLLEGNLRHSLATKNGTSWFLFEINFFLFSGWRWEWNILDWKWTHLTSLSDQFLLVFQLIVEVEDMKVENLFFQLPSYLSSSWKQKMWSGRYNFWEIISLSDFRFLVECSIKVESESGGYVFSLG